MSLTCITWLITGGNFKNKALYSNNPTLSIGSTDCYSWPYYSGGLLNVVCTIHHDILDPLA